MKKVIVPFVLALSLLPAPSHAHVTHHRYGCISSNEFDAIPNGLTKYHIEQFVNAKGHPRAGYHDKTQTQIRYRMCNSRPDEGFIYIVYSKPSHEARLGVLYSAPDYSYSKYL